MPHPHPLHSFRIARGWRIAGGVAAAAMTLAAGPAARADNLFSCPAPRSAVRQKTQPVHEPTLAAGGPIVLEADHFKSVVGGHETARGHVIATQGQRILHSEDADYDKSNDTVRVAGKLEFEDPLIHLTGSDGQLLVPGRRQLP